MPQEDDYGDRVKYEVLNEDLFPEWESHVEVGDGLYVGDYRDEIPKLESIDALRVIDPDCEDERLGGFHFPPEPVVEDGVVKIVMPSENNRSIQKNDLTQWRCQSCGSIEMTNPYTLDGESEPEPSYCAHCESGNRTFELAKLPDGVSKSDIKELIPNSTPLWQIPNGIDDPDMDTLFEDVRDHIYKHWDGPEWLYDGLAAYAISTWIRPDLDFVPHLLIQGTHESGKTRLLNTMKEVSYRCVHTASPSAASIFRAIDASNVTMFLSEYHDLGEEVQQQVDAVVKSGQKRGEVALRATEQQGGGYKAEAYDPFAHVAISTQFTVDDDIESRCFKVKTQKATREVPRTVADRDDLRQRLLGLRVRFTNSPKMEEMKQSVKEKMDSKGLYNRVGEKLSPVMLVAEMFDVDIDGFIAKAVEKDKKAKSETEEAAFIRALIDETFDFIADLSEVNQEHLSDDWSEVEIKLSHVAERWAEAEDRDYKPQYMGQIRNRLGFGKVDHKDGIYIQSDNFKQKLKDKAEIHGVDWEPREYGPESDEPWLNGDVDDGEEDEAEEDEQDTPETNDTAEPTQADRIGLIKDVVSELSDEGEQGAPVGAVCGKLSNHGIDPDTAMDQIEQLRKNGELYSPTEGEVKVS
jgi:hypothetical protein